MARARKKMIAEEEKQEMAYRVTAKIDGFRRAGIIHFGARDYEAGELSEEQLAAIEAEPLLLLERLKIHNEEPDEQKQEAVSGVSHEQGM